MMIGQRQMFQEGKASSCENKDDEERDEVLDFHYGIS